MRTIVNSERILAHCRLQRLLSAFQGNPGVQAQNRRAVLLSGRRTARKPAC